ncbi:MAG: hypothetical protein ACREBS_10020 [Nitrososphaerales archaeon]
MSEEELPELTMPQFFEQFKNRWVAILVTKRDRNGQPLAGTLVADDVDRYRLRQTVVKYNDVCIFYAGEPPFPLFL